MIPRDLRFAIRNLRRTPLFTVAAVLSLTAGIATWGMDIQTRAVTIDEAFWSLYGTKPLEDPRTLLSFVCEEDRPALMGAVEAAISQANTGLSGKEAGPSEADIAAAEEMSSADRLQMIEGMVAALDEKLRREPGDSESWRRLIRSYVVLGRADDARSALERAKTGLEADPEQLREVTEFAAGLGIETQGGKLQ